MPDWKADSVRNAGWYLRRAIVLFVVVAQLLAIAAAYTSAHPFFGFQMFREASDWQAEIYRVTPDGQRIDVRSGWEYEWSELVEGRGLGHPFVRHHATSGLESTFDFLQAALDWVALHTPADRDTRWLEADVTFWENGRGPEHRTLRSIDRSEARP